MAIAKKIVATLGVAAVLGASCIPLSSYAANNSSSTNATTVKVTVADSISIALVDKSSANGIAMEANQYIDSKFVSGAANQILHKLNVTTNSVKGYKLTVIDSDGDNALKNTATASIPAIQSSANGVLTAGTAAWGWQSHDGEIGGATDTTIEQMTSIPNTSGSWKAVPANTSDAALIRNHQTAATAQYTEPTYVRYGVATAADQAAGVYSDDVVYTATVNL